MRVLALDQASKTGWALGTIEGGIASCGSNKVKGDEVGHFLVAFEDWLRVFLDENPVDLIVFEKPILPGQTQLSTLRKLYYLSGHIEVAAIRRGIEVRECFMQEWRSKFIGTSRAPRDILKHSDRQKWIKARSLDRCKELGYPATNHDEADACGIWNFICGPVAERFFTGTIRRPTPQPVDDVTL